MINTLHSLALAASFASVFAVGSVDERIARETDRIESRVIAWRRDVHQHPELGNREFRTSKLVAEHLRRLGMDVKTGVAKTGVVGLLKGGKPGPVVALRADMDGLPVTERTPVPFASKVRADYNGQEVGVSHACGHDTHVAMLMGAAELLAGMREELAGSVKFIFQPAEEGPPAGEEGGAELMVKEGVLEDPKVDVIFALHIDSETEVGWIEYRPGGIMASVNDMKIVVKGRPAHGASPWTSVDPIVVAAQIINSLQTIVSRNMDVSKNASVVTIGAIHGGNRSNIIPETVEMLGTLRALTSEDEKRLIDRVKTVVTKTAEAAGAEAEVTVPYSSRYPVTYNQPELTERMLPSLRKAAGEKRVRHITAITGAEDFSFFQQKVPGLYVFLTAMPKGANPLAAQHHTPDFFVDESALKTGVRAFLYLTLDYMAQAAAPRSSNGSGK